MTDQPRYVLNRNPEGVSVLHRNPQELCNTDDAKDRASIDEATGSALEMSGDVALCAHCYPTEETAP